MSANPRFELGGASLDMILDRETGLTWTRDNAPGGRMVHADAVDACAKLNLGGHADWRLPTRKELLTLVDDTRSSPAIDVDFFPDCPSDWFWTSTPYAPVEGCAWFVFFNDGYAYGLDRDSLGFVRAVRGGQIDRPLAKVPA